VRKANDGLDACEMLRDQFSKQVVWTKSAEWGNGDGADWHSPVAKGNRVAIKLKPTFEPFNIASGFTVQHLPDTDSIKIGCQEFRLNDAKAILCNFISNNSHSVQHGDAIFQATRRGIQLDGEGTGISWKDADEILAAIQKVSP
jgi:hypothetical protein